MLQPEDITSDNWRETTYRLFQAQARQVVNLLTNEYLVPWPAEHGPDCFEAEDMGDEFDNALNCLRTLAGIGANGALIGIATPTLPKYDGAKALRAYLYSPGVLEADHDDEQRRKVEWPFKTFVDHEVLADHWTHYGQPGDEYYADRISDTGGLCHELLEIVKGNDNVPSL